MPGTRRRRVPRRSSRPLLPRGAGWPALLLLPLALAGCVPAQERISGRVFPLPRHEPHDGLAVVTRPGGEGLHLWLTTDTSTPGVCRPRWTPRPARLRGGDGPTPSSFGTAPRSEFHAALRSGRLRWLLRRELEALCRARAPRSTFAWLEPPRSAAEEPLQPLPLWEERHLLSHPAAVKRAEKTLLGMPLSPEDFDDKPLPPVPAGP
jgi:hypothetical protein